MPRSARLVWCLHALLFIEGLFFTALAPLLPSLKSSFDFSSSQVGLLAAAYVAGALVGAVPAALSSDRRGVKACTVTGVALLAGGTFAFAICGTYLLLLISQLVAGVGATGIWIGGGSWLLSVNPPDERGK